LILLCFIIYILWGLGIGDWGLGSGGWGVGARPPTPHPQPPIPNPQSPIPIIIKDINFINIFKLKLKFKL
jgi:hypothetical protein